MNKIVVLVAVAIVLIIVAVVIYIVTATPASSGSGSGSGSGSTTPPPPVTPYVLPAGLVNGVVYGIDGLGIWKLENNTRRWYSPTAYAAAGSPAWTRYADAAMWQTIPLGADM